MTTFTLPGYDILYGPPDNDGPAISFANTNFTIVTNDSNPNFTYSYNTPTDTEVTIMGSDINATVNSGGTTVTLDDGFEAEIFNLIWGAGNVTTIINFFGNVGGQNRDFAGVLGGTPLPVINTLAGLLAFEASVTGESRVTSGPLAPGATILYANLPGSMSTETEAGTITGTSGDDNLSGDVGNDTIFGGDGNDTLTGGIGRDSIDGGAGTDTFVLDSAFADVRVAESNGVYSFFANGEVDTVRNVENFQFLDQVRTLSQLDIVAPVVLTGGDTPDTLTGDIGNDVLNGGVGNDSLDGGEGNDRLLGGEGDDSLFGGDGADTLNAGVGDDFIVGGDTTNDLRDVIYGGDGDDSIDGGYGNDLIFGQGGNDTIAGGFGSDTLQGQDGNDVLTGSALSDLVFGNAGDDFVNGGFGHDRINGGTGADRFFHLGIRDHGSDWIQDYSSGEGDILLFGNSSATAADFQVNFAHTATPAGERSGDDNVQEAFVIYRPTGQIMWALIDGAGQSEINIRIGSDEFDLLT